MWNSNFMFRPSKSCFGLAGINKRKMEADPSDYQLHPNKVLITEEKMVSQLKGIHLSQDFTTHGDPGPSNVDSPRSSLPTLVMCDEIRELQNKVQSPIPPQIYSNLRPTNALVLWRPPAGELGKYLSNIRDSAKEEAQQANLDVDMVDDDNNNNNNNDISSSQNFNATFSTPV